MNSESYLATHFFCLIGLMMVLPASSLSQPLSSHQSWEGVLNVPGQSLTVVFHFSVSDDARITGSMDSPDQGATGIPLAEVSQNDNGLSLTAPSIGGSFRGTVSPSGDKIAGVWSQAGQRWPLTLVPSERSAPAPSPSEPVRLDFDAAATWTGRLAAGTVNLRLVFHLVDTEVGGLSGTMDSPDQGAAGIPLGAVTGDGQNIRIAVPSVGGTYSGTYSSEDNILAGTWSQGGRSLQLTLKRADDR